jgi:hypothetical protein
MPANPEEPPVDGFRFVPLFNGWYNLVDKLSKASSALTKCRLTMTLGDHEKRVKEIRCIHMKEKQARRVLLMWLLSNHNNELEIVHLDITQNIAWIYKNTPEQVKESRLNHEFLLTGVTKELDPLNSLEEEKRFIAEKRAEYMDAHLLDSLAQ